MHVQQAAAEGVMEDFDTIEFFGEKFRLADRVSMMPMMAFGMAAKQGMDSNDMDGLAAMYRMIRAVIHRPALLDEHGQARVDESGRKLRDESEWNRFQQVADDELADGDDIMTFVNKAMEVMSARPTQRPGISSASSPTTSENSRAVSSSPVTQPPPGLTRVADL